MSDLDAVLQENLSRFCQPPSDDSLFQTHREISIARYALNQQAEAYHRSINLLQTLLEAQQIPANTSDIPRILSSVFSLVQAIEAKSQKLIESAQRVQALVGSAVSLDVDKAKLHNLCLSLPHMLRECLHSLDCEEEVTSKITDMLSQKLSHAMSSLRFASPVQAAPVLDNGLFLDQFHELVNSVPTQ